MGTLTWRKFFRLKLIAYDINQIWNPDLAQLTSYQNNRQVNCLSVAIDNFSLYSKVEPWSQLYSQ